MRPSHVALRLRSTPSKPRPAARSRHIGDTLLNAAAQLTAMIDSAAQRESIDAHLAIVFAALAVTRFIEDRTGWSIKRFVRTARRCRTIQIRAGQHILTAKDPLPPDLRDALALNQMTTWCGLT